MNNLQGMFDSLFVLVRGLITETPATIPVIVIIIAAYYFARRKIVKLVFKNRSSQTEVESSRPSPIKSLYLLVEFFLVFFASVFIAKAVGFHTPSPGSALNDRLAKSAAILNKRLPMMVGDGIRMDHVAVSGKELDYKYTMINSRASDLDGHFTDDYYSNEVNLYCKGKGKSFFKSGVFIQDNYYDKDGVFIKSTLITPSTCSSHVSQVDGPSHKSNVVALIKRGEAAFSGFKLDKAVADFSEAIRLDPKNEKAYFWRGRTWDDMGELEKAIADYSEAISLNPKNSSAFLERGMSLLKKGDYRMAIADFSEAISLNPKCVRAYYLRASVYQILVKDRMAIADLNKAIKLNPMFADAYYARGISFEDEGLHKRAMSDYAQAKKLNPKGKYPAFSHMVQ